MDGMEILQQALAVTNSVFMFGLFLSPPTLITISSIMALNRTNERTPTIHFKPI
jgi:hypothetical protein